MEKPGNIDTGGGDGVNKQLKTFKFKGPTGTGFTASNITLVKFDKDGGTTFQAIPVSTTNVDNVAHHETAAITEGVNVAGLQVYEGSITAIPSSTDTLLAQTSNAQWADTNNDVVCDGSSGEYSWSP